MEGLFAGDGEAMIRIDNLDATVTEQDIIDLFGQYRPTQIRLIGNPIPEWAGVILSPEDAACAISDIDGRELYGQELRITHASQRDRSIFNLLPPEPSENLPSRKRPREEEDEGNYDPSYGTEDDYDPDLRGFQPPQKQGNYDRDREFDSGQGGGFSRGGGLRNSYDNYQDQQYEFGSGNQPSRGGGGFNDSASRNFELRGNFGSSPPRNTFGSPSRSNFDSPPRSNNFGGGSPPRNSFGSPSRSNFGGSGGSPARGNFDQNRRGGGGGGGYGNDGFRNNFGGGGNFEGSPRSGRGNFDGGARGRGNFGGRGVGGFDGGRGGRNFDGSGGGNYGGRGGGGFGRGRGFDSPRGGNFDGGRGGNNWNSGGGGGNFGSGARGGNFDQPRGGGGNFDGGRGGRNFDGSGGGGFNQNQGGRGFGGNRGNFDQPRGGNFGDGGRNFDRVGGGGNWGGGRGNFDGPPRGNNNFDGPRGNNNFDGPRGGNYGGDGGNFGGGGGFRGGNNNFDGPPNNNFGGGLPNNNFDGFRGPNGPGGNFGGPNGGPPRGPNSNNFDGSPRGGNFDNEPPRGGGLNLNLNFGNNPNNNNFDGPPRGGNMPMPPMPLPGNNNFDGPPRGGNMPIPPMPLPIPTPKVEQPQQPIDMELFKKDLVYQHKVKGLSDIVFQPEPLQRPKFKPPIKLESLTDHQLSVQPIYIIDFETAVSVGTFHIPVELAACVFNVSQGETASFHKFIDPGSIPKCHLASALFKKELHGIPFIRFELTEKIYKALWSDLTKFFDFTPESTGPQPLIYGKGATTLNYCMNWLATKSGEENIFGQIQPIESLLEYIHERSARPITTSAIQNFFIPKIRNEVKLHKCKYHIKTESENIDKSRSLNCALANVRFLSHLSTTTLAKELQRKYQLDKASKLAAKK